MHDALLNSTDEVARIFLGSYGDLSLPRELCHLTELTDAWAKSDDVNVKHMASRVNGFDPELDVDLARAAFDQACRRLTQGALLHNTLLELMNTASKLLVSSDFSDSSLKEIATVAERFVNGTIPLLANVDSRQTGSMLTPMSHFEAGIFITALCKVEHSAFDRLMDVLVPLVAERASKFRKDTRHGHPPASYSGVFAALALAPTLSAGCEKALLKLAGKQNLTPMAFLALYRHGHAATTARLSSLSDLATLRGLLDFGQADAHPLYFVSASGAQWLRAEMISEGRWHAETISAARALGIWTAEAQEAWVKAVERGDSSAAGLIASVPVLSDEAHARVRAVLPDHRVREFDLRQPRTFDAAKNLMHEVARMAVPLVHAVEAARSISNHFDELRALYPSDLRVQLTIDLASTPELTHRTPNETSLWAHVVRNLEPRWVPERHDAPAPKTAPKQKAKA